MAPPGSPVEFPSQTSSMGSGHDGKRRHFLQRRLTRRSGRSVLVDDKVITTKIKKGFFDSVIPALGLSVFCHQGLVVLAGAADPQIGDKAVAVARAVLRCERFVGCGGAL